MAVEISGFSVVEGNSKHARATRLNEAVFRMKIKDYNKAERIILEVVGGLESECAVEATNTQDELEHAHYSAAFYFFAGEFDKARHIAIQYLEKAKGTDFYQVFEEVLKGVHKNS